jgi:hypothetical protein
MRVELLQGIFIFTGKEVVPIHCVLSKDIMKLSGVTMIIIIVMQWVKLLSRHSLLELGSGVSSTTEIMVLLL